MWHSGTRRFLKTRRDGDSQQIFPLTSELCFAVCRLTVMNSFSLWFLWCDTGALPLWLHSHTWDIEFQALWNLPELHYNPWAQTHKHSVITDTQARLTTAVGSTTEATAAFTTSGRGASDMELLHSLSASDTFALFSGFYNHTESRVTHVWCRASQIKHFLHFLLLEQPQLEIAAFFYLNWLFPELLSGSLFSSVSPSAWPQRGWKIFIVPFNSVDLDSWEGARCCLDSFLTLQAHFDATQGAALLSSCHL